MKYCILRVSFTAQKRKATSRKRTYSPGNLGKRPERREIFMEHEKRGGVVQQFLIVDHILKTRVLCLFYSLIYIFMRFFTRGFWQKSETKIRKNLWTIFGVGRCNFQAQMLMSSYLTLKWIDHIRIAHSRASVEWQVWRVEGPQLQGWWCEHEEKRRTESVRMITSALLRRRKSPRSIL